MILAGHFTSLEYKSHPRFWTDFQVQKSATYTRVNMVKQYTTSNLKEYVAMVITLLKVLTIIDYSTSTALLVCYISKDGMHFLSPAFFYFSTNVGAIKD